MKREDLLKKRIGVIYGGLSSERDVSLETGQAVHRGLVQRGYDAVLIDQDRDLPARLIAEKIDVAFIALHGKWGEDGCLQGLCEVMGIPYTGAKVFGSALAMEKYQAKIIFKDAGIPVAPAIFLANAEEARSLKASDLPFGLPCVVKPNADGSSVGISIVKQPEELLPAIEKALALEDRLMVEAYIAGREIQVSLLNGQALGAIWVKPAGEFYDYAAKYLEDTTEYIYPAPLPASQYAECLQVAERANAVVRGQGAVRVDLIVRDDGSLVILELNTLPGMTSHSLVPKTAAAKGIPFDDMMERILLAASLDLHPPIERNDD